VHVNCEFLYGAFASLDAPGAIWSDQRKLLISNQRERKKSCNFRLEGSFWGRKRLFKDEADIEYYSWNASIFFSNQQRHFGYL
jgi:hypothetical protein